MTTLTLDTTQVPGAAGGVGPILGPPDPGILERNLAALARWSPGAAEQLRICAPRADLRFLRTDEGAASVEVVPQLGAPRALASRRRPRREGETLADTIDISASAAVAVMGFGAGYQVEALARRMRRTGLVAVFEPDLGLLRAVLERIDHSEWLASSNTAIFTDPDDAATITARLAGAEGIVMAGLSLLEHPPSLERLGEARTRFYRNLQDVIAAIRTMVATSMVLGRTTFSNVTRNLGWYASCPGIGELAGTWAARPAIVVSAGPSLARNIEQLARPGVRERFVVIATQTVLKPLLARGIRPHFVVALDHSVISARFYEGLREEDVRGVTLVVEPKVSPAVPRAFPGEIRLASDPILDRLLGPELSRPMGTLPPGATVAHLAYYLARHLGADPVVLVGQDLGFTDGQYYAAGASIHNVWACELHQCNSLERMEWERIKRMGSHLRRATDHAARPIYTDEQMATYLVQFERDFLADTHRGLSIIDATEGGVAKRHTRAEALASVVERVLATPAPIEAPPVGAAPGRTSLRRVEERVREAVRGTGRVAELSREAAGVLREMLAHHADQRLVGRLIDRVHALRDEAEATEPAIALVHALNQAGAFARLRTDRSIQLDATLTPLERQRREIERDIANVELLARSADDLRAMLDDAARGLVGWRPGAAGPAYTTPRAAAFEEPETLGPVPALVRVEGSSLEQAGAWTLELTLRRLARCRRVSEIVVLAPEASAVESAVSACPKGVAVRVVRCGAPDSAAARRVRAARAVGVECWRGGLGGASVHDEALDASAMHRVLDELSAEAALVVRHDWCAIDPAVCDGVIERAQRSRSTHRIAFTQAPPGAGGVVLGKRVLHDLARLGGEGPGMSLGGLISYMPGAPCLDPIGRDNCVPVDPALRDCGLRLVPDSPARAAAFRRVVDELGMEATAAMPATEIARRVRAVEDALGVPPVYLAAEIGPEITAAVRELLVEASAEAACITLRAAPGCLGAACELAPALRASGCVVHVRATLPEDDELLRAIECDILSLDFPLPSDERTWSAADRQCADALVARRANPRLASTWIVPRITKRDETCAFLEAFYDRWLVAAGAACIDPLPVVPDGARLAPLPLPSAASERFSRTAMYIRADGTVDARDLFERVGGGPAGDIRVDAPLMVVWRRVLDARAAEGVR
jgi:hypothetical protein